VSLRLSLAAAALAAVALGPAPAAEPTPERLLQDVRSLHADVSGAVALKQVTIELGPASMEVERGILVPARTAGGRALELVFVGQARVRLEAPDAIEAGQLELFTGGRSLEAPVEEAVLVLADDRAVEALLSHPAPRELRAELAARIAAVHASWRDGAERRRAGVEASLFRSLAGDAAFARYFAVFCRSFELGEFVIEFDPEDVESVTLAAFRPVKLEGWDRARLRHQIRVQQRKERWLDVRLEDLGSWDIWLSTAWAPDGGPPLAAGVGFETTHYEIEATIRKDRMWLDARARLDLDVAAPGRRVVRLELFPDLVVRRIADGSGRELFFFRSGDQLLVYLPQPPRAGERIALEIDYDGRALHWVRSGVFDLAATSGWYPHCGSVDRATYDVTLRWPRKRQLVASGRRVAGGRDGDFAWERRRLDLPAIGFSFLVGEFVVDERQVGHVELKLAFARDPRRTLDSSTRSEVMQVAAEALEYFERTLGRYPLDELTLVTMPRGYSQSYLGFITLAESAMWPVTPPDAAARWRRATTIAHEVAHQWWGNLVGWWSYRDQWLSEGMANYSALLFHGSRPDSAAEHLALMSSGWRESLTTPTLDGRTVESLGPVVLGARLNSSRASDGYRMIVYRKGAAVLAMLARAVGEERFIAMLRSLAEAAAGRVVTTEGFLESVERMGAIDLAGFAEQFVYGTGIPEVVYSFEAVPGGHGGWAIEGQARLMAAPSYAHRVTRSAAGRWQVERLPGPRPGAGPATLVVPYLVTLDVPAHDVVGRRGQLLLGGGRSGFRIETEVEPVDLRLDPEGVILAWFYSEQRNPKRVLRYEAEELANEGRWDEAEARYREALALPAETDAAVDPLGPPPSAPRLDTRLEDLKIRLSLVRMQIGRGRMEQAETDLERIDHELSGDTANLLRVEREALRARLELQRGAFAAAHRRLRRTLQLASPERGQRPWREVLFQMQLSTERVALAEASALLTLAAFELGSADDLAWALREAKDRGVDVSAMERGGT